MRARGYLMVELLAVVALVALLFARVAPSVVARSVGGDGASACRVGVSGVRSIDRTARAFAIRQGPVWLRADGGGRLSVWTDDLSERLTGGPASVCGCVLLDGATGRVVGAIRFDRLGRTGGYTVRVGDGVDAVLVAFGVFGEAGG